MMSSLFVYFLSRFIYYGNFQLMADVLSLPGRQISSL